MLGRGFLPLRREQAYQPKVKAQATIAVEATARGTAADQRLPKLLRPQMANRSAGSSRETAIVKVTYNE